MPCVHWEFSLGAFLCTCAEHNSSPFLRSGIANSRGKKMGSTRAKPGGYLITECGPEVFFFIVMVLFFSNFVLMLLLDMFCLVEDGKLGWGRRQGQHLYKHFADN